MKQVLAHIAQKRSDFSQLPFFAYLRDPRVAPEKRFVFAPAGAPFIMAFADLNRYILHVAEPQDPLQELINVHSDEDSTHFSMYLVDLETLGYDLPLRFTDALEFLWADERKSLRQTCYALAAMLASASPPLRLVIVETIEAMGSVAFQAFSAAATEYHAATGKTLQYFGQRHEALETGHTMGTDDVERRLSAIVLDEDAAARARELVDVVFRSFSEMMNELHQYAIQNHAEKQQ